ncbi:MAG: M48 family metalloprotease [Candidatus Acidiferrales bacterium]
MRAVKTTVLLTALTLLLIFVGQRLAGNGGMLIALAFAVVMNASAYFLSDKIALASSGAKPVTREEAPRLYAVMERLCGKSGIPMPKLYVIPEQAPNAFATGRNPSHASVAATAGLLQLLDDEELEGVIAHELSHVRNYDILTSSIAAMLAGAIFVLARMGEFAMIFGGYGGGSRDSRRGSALTMLLLIIVAPLAALILQLGISRQREYSADASGANLVGHPEGLIRALQKLGAYNKRIPSNMPQTTSALCIVAPLSPRELTSGLFSTHPALEDRIAQLRNMIITR